MYRPNFAVDLALQIDLDPNDDKEREVDADVETPAFIVLITILFLQNYNACQSYSLDIYNIDIILKRLGEINSIFDMKYIESIAVKSLFSD